MKASWDICPYEGEALRRRKESSPREASKKRKQHEHTQAKREQSQASTTDRVLNCL